MPQQNNNEAVRQSVMAYFEIIKAMMDVIEYKKEIPSGELYAHCMASGVTLQQYQQLERHMLLTGRVVKKGDLLKWIVK